eukprot:scaffold198540_cov29-Tisochrysis_lutea.AAC.11
MAGRRVQGPQLGSAAGTRQIARGLGGRGKSAARRAAPHAPQLVYQVSRRFDEAEAGPTGGLVHAAHSCCRAQPGQHRLRCRTDRRAGALPCARALSVS